MALSPAPTGLTATPASASQINLAWNNSWPYSSIMVYRTLSGGAFAVIATIGGGETSFADNGLADGIFYDYYVKGLALDYGDWSLPSNTGTAVTPLPAPSGLAGTAAPTSVALTWQDNAQNESAYRIYQDGVLVETLGTNVTTKTITGLTGGVWYKFLVRAYNAAAGESGPSNEINIFILDPPSQPTELIATATATTEIRLNWKDNAGNETGSSIEESSTGPTSGFSEIATVGPNVVTYERTGLTSNTQYWYRIHAYNDSGDSPYSNVANAATFAAIAQPTNLIATPWTDTEVELKFQDNSELEDVHCIERASVIGSFVIGASNKVIYFANQADNVVVDGGFEAWLSATNLTNWVELISGTSSINRESTVKVSGNYSCRIDIDAGNSAGRVREETLALLANTEHILTFYYKNSASGKVSDFRLYDTVAGKSINSSGAWVSGSSYVAITNQTGLTRYELKFTTSANTSYDLIIGHSDGANAMASSSLYMDDLYIIPRRAATLTEATYDADATALCAEIKSKMDAAGSGVHTVSFDAGTQKFTFSSATLLYLYLTTTTNALWATIGFPTAADVDFVLSYLGGAITSYVEIVQLEPNRTFYRDTGLTTGLEYEYRVRAKQGGSYSAYSNEATVTTLVAPATPTYLGEIEKQDVWWKIGWYCDGTEVGCKVEQELYGTGSWSEIAVVDRGLPRFSGSLQTYYEFKVTGLSPSTAYQFRVRAYNGAGNSSYASSAFMGYTYAAYTPSKFERLIRKSSPNLIYPVEANPAMVLQGWSLTSGQTYTYENIFNEGGVSIESVQQNGELLIEVTTIAEVESTSGTWYHDVNAGKVYVHTADGDSPVGYLIVATFWMYFTTWKTRAVPANYNDNNYLPLVAADGIPDLSQEIKPFYEGNFSITTGTVSLINGRINNRTDLNHFFDRKCEKYLWLNRKMKILSGGESFAYSDFVTVGTGIINSHDISDQRFNLNLRDYRDGINLSLPAAKYTTDEFANLDVNVVDRPRPFGYGAITNVIPICIDTVNLVFEFHHGRCKSVTQVTQNGTVLTEDTDYFVDYQNGQFTLARGLAYVTDDILLVDFHGWVNLADEEISNGAMIFKHLLNNYLNIGDADLDLDSIYATMAAKTVALNPYIYKEENSQEIIRKLERTLQAYSDQDASGRLGLKAEQTTASTDIKYIPEAYIRDFGSSKDQSNIYNAVNVFYAENPSTDVFLSITKTNPQTPWKDGVQKTLDVYTYLTSSTDADALGIAILAMFGRRPFTFTVNRGLFTSMPGDLIYVSRKRFPSVTGTAANVLMRIQKITKQFSSGKTQITAEVV
ncbi:MAG: hypothetical protein WC347_01025 [Smithellaceae bacterium]|jgi:hypothetical protein